MKTASHASASLFPGVLMRLFVALALVASAAVAAPIAVELPHEGFVLGANDVPLDAPDADLEFGLYTGATSGSPIWSASCATNVHGGYFHVRLGGGCGGALTTAELPPGATRYLELKLGSVTLSPRLAITSAPTAALALHALDADAIGGVPATTLVDAATQKLKGSALPSTISATSFSGDGALLSNLDASQITTGTVAGARLEGTYAKQLALTHAANDLRGTFTGTVTNANLTGEIALPTSASAPFGCDATKAGTTYWDTATSKLFVCAGAAGWQPAVPTVAGATGGLAWAAGALAFSTVSANTTLPLVLWNKGSAAATGLVVFASDGFGVDASACGASLAANTSCSVNVTFLAAGTSGARNGFLAAVTTTGPSALARVSGTWTGPLGATSALAAASCKAIKTANASASSQTYWLDPDGAGGADPYEAYCDMVTASTSGGTAGGWTLCGGGWAPNDLTTPMPDLRSPSGGTLWLTDRSARGSIDCDALIRATAASEMVVGYAASATPLTIPPDSYVVPITNPTAVTFDYNARGSCVTVSRRKVGSATTTTAYLYDQGLGFTCSASGSSGFLWNGSTTSAGCNSFGTAVGWSTLGAATACSVNSLHWTPEAGYNAGQLTLWVR